MIATYGLLLYIVFVLLIIILLTSFGKSYKKNKRICEMLEVFQGNKRLPLIGNAHQFKTSAEGNDFLWKLYKLSEKVGHTSYKFFLGSYPYVGLCEAETAEVMLSSTKEIIKFKDYEFFQKWLGDGLLLSDGTKWRQRRKIITPTFHFKILEQFVNVFNDNSKIFVRQLSNKTGKVIDIYPIANHYALDVICEAAMGVSVNAQLDNNSKYVKAVHSVCKLLNARIISAWKRTLSLYKMSFDYYDYMKNVKTIHDFTKHVIQQRKIILKDEIERIKNGENLLENQDEFIKIRKKVAFLDMLLLSKLPDGSFLSDEDIREETDTFMFEGHDTTSSAIAFAIYELANNPEVQNKALEEVISIVGEDPTKDITYENLQDMKYMEMVIKETLRLYPSVPHYGRKLDKDLALPDGKVIPAGCNVVVDAFSLGRNPRHYADSDKFIPERFSRDNQTGKNPFSFVSFSAGPRNCIGQKFAMLEVKDVLSKLLMNYELSSAGDEAKVRLIQEVILKSSNGIQIVLKERNHNYN